METSLHLLLSSGYLPDEDRVVLLGTHALVKHLDKMRRALSTYDFRWIRNIDENWENQTEISSKKSLAMLACLFHYNLDVSLLMRYLGQNYTAAHRDVQHVVERISPHVDSYLIPHFIRVMTAGCPNVMNTESTRENSVKYWRAGNNPSIAKHVPAASVILIAPAKVTRAHRGIIPHGTRRPIDSCERGRGRIPLQPSPIADNGPTRGLQARTTTVAGANCARAASQPPPPQ